MMDSLRKMETPRQLSAAGQLKRDARVHARQALSSKDIQLMRDWLSRPEFPELVAATDLKARVPQPKAKMCDVMNNQEACCYRTDLDQRMRSMMAWSRPRLPQHLPVLYLYSGVDLFNAFGLFPDSPAFVLCAYHPAFMAGTAMDLFSEARTCMESKDCSKRMVDSAIMWYRHTLCLSLRSSMSSWMAGRHFPIVGTLPALLLETKLLGMEILGATAVAAPSVDGIVMRVRRGGGPVQKVIYIASVFSNATADAIFQEIAQHVSLSHVALLTKGALLEGGSSERKTHAAWLAEQLRSRTQLQAIVQDDSGLAAPLSIDLNLNESLMKLHGNCRGLKRSFFEGMGTRGKTAEDRLRRSVFHALPFPFGHMDPNDEANQGCMMTYVHGREHSKAMSAADEHARP